LLKPFGAKIENFVRLKRMRYFTVTEAADLLHMHPEVVRRLIARQELGAFRKGPRGRFLITQKHIDAFLVPAGADYKVRTRAKAI